jgi:hypothetical protein
MTDDHTNEEPADSETNEDRSAAADERADAGGESMAAPTPNDDGDTAGEKRGGGAEPVGTGDGSDAREDDDKTRDVEVPMRVYKAVTVFTTLFAVVTVVGGFVVLDSATNRARASFSEIDPLLALVGIGLIVAGAAAYAFSTRFRAEGMGKSKDDTDEDSDNG